MNSRPFFRNNSDQTIALVKRRRSRLLTLVDRARHVSHVTSRFMLHFHPQKEDRSNTPLIVQRLSVPFSSQGLRSRPASSAGPLPSSSFREGAAAVLRFRVNSVAVQRTPGAPSLARALAASQRFAAGTRAGREAGGGGRRRAPHLAVPNAQLRRTTVRRDRDHREKFQEFPAVDCGKNVVGGGLMMADAWGCSKPKQHNMH